MDYRKSRDGKQTMVKTYLQATGEAYKVGADTEGGALSCRNTHGGADGVKDGKDNCSEDGEGRDLVHGECLAGD